MSSPRYRVLPNNSRAPLGAPQLPGVSYADLEDAIALVEATISRMQTTRV
ncbi:hypothetical protein AA0311_2594 [Asaia bogorensis NBRC 16594]|nr:hypothetical protein AA0311_2594 [Asaia bogorensis NBRC 16594]